MAETAQNISRDIVIPELFDDFRELVELNDFLGDHHFGGNLELQRNELAIEPSMHVGAPEVEFVDPVVRVEWIAGLLRHALQQDDGFSGNARAMIEEHNLLGGIDDMPLAVVDLSSPGGDASTTLMSLDSLAEYLDSEQD